MSRTYVENHLDFPALGAGLSAIEPPTITAEEVLERLAPQITGAHRRGVTIAQIRDFLKAHKIQVTADELTRFLDGREAKREKNPAKPATRKTQENPPGGELDLTPPGG